MAYVDFAYYAETYGGSQVKYQDFTRLSSKATAYIDSITQNRISDDAGTLTTTTVYGITEDVTEAVKMAACDLIDVIDKDSKGPEIASESVGKQSVSYVQSGKTANQRKYDAVYPWLVGTGLLYRGVI